MTDNQAISIAPASMPPTGFIDKAVLEREFLVVCLCAEWCGTCRDYREGFEALATEFPQASFLWFDVEDDADLVGDFDVENFPTLLIQRRDHVLLYGPQLPDHGLLRRLIQSFVAQTADEASRYAASAERAAWQRECNLRAVLREALTS